MMSDIDPTDARLLDLLQQGIPITQRPFDEIASRLGISPGDAIERTAKLRSGGIIRQISAIFDSAALGYRSALVAFRVSEERVDDVGETVAAHSGVSHCYSRDAGYNLWFTITVGPEGDVEEEVRGLADTGGIESYLLLPAIRVFKIGVFLAMGDEPRTGVTTSDRRRPAPIPEPPRPNLRPAIRALQRDMPLSERPFAELARDAGVSEGELIDQARELRDSGVMRRFAAVLRHQRAGYRSNAMISWRVEPEQVGEVGTKLALDPAVSHCYERPIHPDWPYALYTMVHARSDEELYETIRRLAEAAGAEHLVLRTLKEYKKSRVTYYTD